MNSLMLAGLNNPREKAIVAMRASLPLDQWARNEAFISLRRKKISEHPASRHPAIAILNSGVLEHDAMRTIHLDYRHAIVQIFTDALPAAQIAKPSTGAATGASRQNTRQVPADTQRA